MTNGHDLLGDDATPDAPASAPDAERALLACVFADDTRKHRVVERASAIVAPDDFGNEHNAATWGAILAVHGRGDLPDPATVAEELGARGERAAQKAIGAVRSIAVSPSTFEQHARRVAEHAYRRSYRGALTEALRRCDAPALPTDAVTAAREAMAAAPVTVRGSKSDHIRAAAERTLARIERRVKKAEAGERATAQWGVAAIDGYLSPQETLEPGALGGLFPGKLYVLAGVPGCGKTSLAWMATLATARAGGLVLVFSLEMTAEDICQRLAAQACGISESSIENGLLGDDDVARIGKFLLDDLGALPIHVIGACRTVEEMRSRTLAEASVREVALVVIDFLQRTKPSRRIEDANHADEERVYEAKGLANDADVPVLAVSSMTKAAQVLAGEGKVEVTGTKGSGTEYAADVVAFLVAAVPDDPMPIREVFFKVAKRRGGKLSSPSLWFNRERGSFSSTFAAGRADMPREDNDNELN